jgi:hypothetical protein
MKVEHFNLVKRAAREYAARYRANINTVESAFMLAAIQIIGSVPIGTEPEYTISVSKALGRRLSGLSLRKIQGEENPFGALFKTIRSNSIAIGGIDYDVSTDETIRDTLDFETFISLLSSAEREYVQLLLDGYQKIEIRGIMKRGQHALERIETTLKRKAERWLR